ncbi:MAG: thiamine biosynthesis protein ThiS [Candidatus Cloacimonadota bacterium]|nr:MAG: thiamine biosynthesis protein ThiS [Candidatus Cloacimonadota bacterium]
MRGYLLIMINNNEIFWEKGLTVEKLLRENNFLIHLSIVKINGQLINKKSFATQIISDSDDIKIVHLVAGG